MTVTAAVADPARGHIVDNGDRTFTFTPNSAYAHQLAAGGATELGQAPITFTATDIYGESSSVVENATITPANAAPAVEVTAKTLPGPDGSITYTVATTDADPGETVTVTATVAHPDRGSVVKTSLNTFVYTPDPGYAHQLSKDGSTLNHTDTLTFSADDGHGGTAEAKKTWRWRSFRRTAHPPLPRCCWTARASPPRSACPTLDEDAGDVVDVTVVAAHGTITGGSGTYIYTPDPAYLHELSRTGTTAQPVGTVTITADDGHGGIAEAEVSIPLTGVNHGPVVTLGLPSSPHPQSGATTYPVSANDADEGDTVVFSVLDPPQHGTVTVSGNSIVYTPDPVYAHGLGPSDTEADPFTVTYTDGHGGIGTLDLEGKVVFVNRQPLVVADTTTDATTGKYVAVGTAIDPDGDLMQYVINVPQAAYSKGDPRDGECGRRGFPGDLRAERRCAGGRGKPGIVGGHALRRQRQVDRSVWRGDAGRHHGADRPR